MTRPRLLDLFAGAGGCSVGYHRAGFDVTGVDNRPMPRYPFQFIQADALDVLADRKFLAGFDAIHASPPCQAYSITRHSHSKKHPDLLTPTRVALQSTGKPYVIENVPGAQMPGALVLCGTEFGLSATDIDGKRLWLRRHRLFESSIPLWGAGGCYCNAKTKRIGGVYGGGPSNRKPRPDGTWRYGYTPTQPVRAALMGIDWMTQYELTQAIPPAYCEHIGSQLIDHLAAEREAVTTA